MIDELKPVKCGCGGEAIIGLNEWEDRKGNYHENSFVYCADCSVSTMGFLTEAEAIKTWNTTMGANRVQFEAVERMAKVTDYTENVCGIEAEGGGKCECGNWVYDELPYCPHCGIRLY